MPFKVIFSTGNNEIGSRECETKTEAVAYAKARHSFQLEATSAIVVDDDSSEIVFTAGQAKASNAPRPQMAVESMSQNRPRDTDQLGNLNP